MFLTRKILLLATVLFTAVPATAALRSSLHSAGTQHLAEGDLEWEQWLWTKQNRTTNALNWLWMSMVYGFTNRIEVQTPIEFLYDETRTAVADVSLQVRFLLTDPTPAPDATWSSSLKLTQQKNFQLPAQPKSEWQGLGWANAWTSGSHELLIDLSTIGDYTHKSTVVFQTAVVGYWYRTGRAKWGLEAFQEQNTGSTKTDVKPVQYAGPTISYAQGRFWLTLGVHQGLNDDSPEALSRLILGAFL